LANLSIFFLRRRALYPLLIRIAFSFSLAGGHFHGTAGRDAVYPLGINRRISFMSLALMICDCLRLRLRLVVFLVNMWLPWDLAKAYLPLPVFLNRLAADRLVLIFGIPSLLID
jgi:hypothetical protein